MRHVRPVLRLRSVLIDHQIALGELTMIVPQRANRQVGTPHFNHFHNAVYMYQKGPPLRLSVVTLILKYWVVPYGLCVWPY